MYSPTSVLYTSKVFLEEMGLLQNPNLLFLNKAWTVQAINAGALKGVKESDVKDGLNLNAGQMESLLTYFKNNDMNGNGKTDDERPLNFVYNNWQGNQCDLYGMFGLNDNLEHRVIVDGKVTYTTEGYRIANEVLLYCENEEYLKMVQDIAISHHEKWNGTGYPKQLKETQIPLSARIMAIADVFDALVSPRCYKEPISEEKAFEIIEKDSGIHFDPVLTEIFLEIKTINHKRICTENSKSTLPTSSKPSMRQYRNSEQQNRISVRR